jgi:hypothetical protein
MSKNDMLNCGASGDYWARYALGCVPDDLWNEWHDKLAFVCLAGSDGRRLNRAAYANRDIIILSERIVPKEHANEGSPDVRYFVFCVLHETAHVICRHRPPNQISTDENVAQEAEANSLAFRWFNDYLQERNHPDLPEFTLAELNRAQAGNQAAMRAALGQR